MDLTPIPRSDVVRHHAGDPAISSLHPQIVTLADGRVLMGFEGRTVEGGAGQPPRWIFVEAGTDLSASAG